MEKKTLFIFGISSFVGSNLAYLLRDKYRIIGTYFNTPVHIDNVLTLKCDVLNKDAVLNIMAKFKPEYTLYCVGLTGFSDALSSPALSEALNSNGVFNVTAGSERSRSKLIFLSSHFVFSGENIFFKPTDMPMPCTKYGNDLASSEFYIQRTSLNYIIFRCPPLLGKSFNPKENKFLELIEYKLSAGDEIACDDEVKHGYISVEFLSKVIQLSLDKNITNELIQVGSPDTCTRYEFAKRYLTLKGASTNLLSRKKWVFPRTENKVALQDLEDKLYFNIDVSAAQSALGIEMQTISETIKSVLPLSNNKNSNDIDFI
jgi:dTDP-4-dehydrorhamnose reductase